jgi:4-amino-4-deoxy-L-arabinose transferase-like glycosyltransferase
MVEKADAVTANARENRDPEFIQERNLCGDVFESKSHDETVNQALSAGIRTDLYNIVRISVSLNSTAFNGRRLLVNCTDAIAGLLSPYEFPASPEVIRLQTIQKNNAPNAVPQKPGAKSETSARFRLLLLSIVMFAALLYVSLSACWPKFSRAEVFFSECAREMILQSNYVTPLYHAQPFFDKPILTYWLIIASFKAFGMTHLAARIPSILAGLATVAVTGSCTAYMFGRRAGLLAAMALASSFMFFSFAALCMSDALLVLFDTLTIALLYGGLLYERRRDAYWYLAAATTGLAFLTKGPVGLVLPAVSFLIYLALTKRIGLLKPRHCILGAIIAGLIASPWFFAAFAANGTWAMAYFFIRENFTRYTGAMYDTHKPVWFMVVSLFAGFAPWCVFLPFAGWKTFKSWRKKESASILNSQLYLWTWIAVLIGFFSFSRGKCDYYALPIYPAAAALVGHYLATCLVGNSRPLAIAGWALALASLVASIGSFVIIPKIVGGESVAQWIVMPASLLVCSAVIAASTWRGRYFQAIYAMFAGVCIAASGFAFQVLPAIGKLQMTTVFASEIKSTPPQTKIGIDASLAHWTDELTFQTGREPVKLDSGKKIADFLAAGQPAVAILPESALQKLPMTLLGNLRIVDKHRTISHSLTPGYAIKRKGDLRDAEPLVLITNQP